MASSVGTVVRDRHHRSGLRSSASVNGRARGLIPRVERSDTLYTSVGRHFERKIAERDTHSPLRPERARRARISRVSAPHASVGIPMRPPRILRWFCETPDAFPNSPREIPVRHAFRSDPSSSPIGPPFEWNPRSIQVLGSARASLLPVERGRPSRFASAGLSEHQANLAKQEVLVSLIAAWRLSL
jgi:hypothetical protein